jgi:hypothetical protein
MIENSSGKPSHAQAAELIGVSQTKMTALTNGIGTITVGDLDMLARKLGFTDERYINDLMEIRRDNHKRGFWSTGHNRVYPAEFRLMVDLERNADSLRYCQSEIAPGVAQWEGYVRALLDGVAEQDGVTVEDMVQARLARGKVVTGDAAGQDREPPQTSMVLSESSLRREYGSTEIMREQMEHLYKLSKLPNILIQVLPFKSKQKTVLTSSFVLVRVPSPGIAGPLEIAYAEGEGDVRYLDDKDALNAHDKTWARLTAAALNADDSRKFIRYVQGSFGGPLKSRAR